MNRINTRQVQWGIKFHMQGQLDFKSSKLVNLLYIWVSNTWGFPSDSELKNLPAKEEMQETGFDPWVRKIPWRRKWQPIPVWEMPWAEEPGRPQSMGRRVRHN